MELHSLYCIKQVYRNFNTTFVHVEPDVFSLYFALTKISIQHLYMWSISKRYFRFWHRLISIQHLYMWSTIFISFQKNLLKNFNTTFVHVERFCIFFPIQSILISIQHLYMWSIRLVSFSYSFKSISIQHLYMWSNKQS